MEWWPRDWYKPAVPQTVLTHHLFAVENPPLTVVPKSRTNDDGVALFSEKRCIAEVATVLADPLSWSQRKNGHAIAHRRVQRVNVIVIGKGLVRAKSNMVLLSTRCAKGGGGPQY